MIQSTVPDYRRLVTLMDGKQVVLRATRRVDKEALLSMFDRCSPETRLLRFHYLKPRITEEEVEQYCGTDCDSSFALVAEMRRGDRDDIVGTGIYYRLARPETAEVAFIVEDREQRNGICTHLLKALGMLARERGITTFVAETLTENTVMADIFLKYAPTAKQVWDGSSLHLTFPAK